MPKLTRERRHIQNTYKREETLMMYQCFLYSSFVASAQFFVLPSSMFDTVCDLACVSSGVDVGTVLPSR